MLFAKVARICLQEGESQAELGGWVQLGPEERVLKVPQRAFRYRKALWGGQRGRDLLYRNRLLPVLRKAGLGRVVVWD
jgi:hypothetical protein